MKDFELARKNIADSGILYDIECLATTLMLVGCFEKANETMDWSKIGEIVSFCGREIDAKRKLIQKELNLSWSNDD